MNDPRRDTGHEYSTRSAGAARSQRSRTWEFQSYVILAASAIILLVVVGLYETDGNNLWWKSYSYLVDFWLVAVLPVGLYPFFGGKIWCRYWCPLAAWNQLLAWRLNQGDDPVAEIAEAKVQATTTFEFCAREAAQILGGASYLRGSVVERLYREVRVQAIGGGSEEIMVGHREGEHPRPLGHLQRET